MDSGVEAVVEGFYAAVRVRDIDATISYCHDDVHIVQHYFDPALPFSGKHNGRAAAHRSLGLVFKSWRYVEFTPTTLSIEGSSVRTRCPTVIQHIATGATINVTFRHMFTIEDGRIRRFETYFDFPRMRAFLHYIGIGAER